MPRDSGLGALGLKRLRARRPATRDSRFRAQAQSLEPRAIVSMRSSPWRFRRLELGQTLAVRKSSQCELLRTRPVIVFAPLTIVTVMVIIINNIIIVIV